MHAWVLLDTNSTKKRILYDVCLYVNNKQIFIHEVSKSFAFLHLPFWIISRSKDITLIQNKVIQI